MITAAVGDAARAQGMTKIARDACLSKAIPYRALHGGARPGLDTTLRVLGAPGVKLTATAA